MASRIVPCLAALLAVGLAGGQDASSQLEAAVKEKESLAKQLEEAKARLAETTGGETADLPLTIVNNAGNNVTLANCLESYELQAGDEIATTFLTGGFWVLPSGADFNCSRGCADCFYLKMQWTERDGVAASIGFGVDGDVQAAGSAAPVRPEGGGLKLSVSGAGSVECTDFDCGPGWSQMICVPDGSFVNVTIEGSSLAGPAPVNGTVSANGIVPGGCWGARRGRCGRPGFRRPIRRRPAARRPAFRRPVYRPIYRPIYAPAPTCTWCNQFGRSTCWWLCR